MKLRFSLIILRESLTFCLWLHTELGYTWLSDVSAIIPLHCVAINSSLQSHPVVPVPSPSHCMGQSFCSSFAKNFHLTPDSPAKDAQLLVITLTKDDNEAKSPLLFLTSNNMCWKLGLLSFASLHTFPCAALPPKWL